MNLDINFNFYSGDFQSSESVSFTIIVAVVSIILTGIVTIISQRFYDNFKNCESSDLVFDYIHEEAKKLGNSALIQSDALIKITKSLKSEAVADYNIAKVTGFNVEQIKEWETVVFYNSIVFRRDASPDSLMKLHSDIKMAFNHARAIERAIMLTVEEMNEKLIKAQDNWKDHVQSIGDFFDFYIIHQKAANSATDSFLIQYRDIIRNWKQLPANTEISLVYNRVVQPLFLLCRQHPNDSEAFNLQRELIVLRGVFIELQHIKNMYRRWFVLHARKLVKINLNLMQGFDSIIKIKRKRKYHF